jgi:hypothetical protein
MKNVKQQVFWGHNFEIKCSYSNPMPFEDIKNVSEEFNQS